MPPQNKRIEATPLVYPEGPIDAKLKTPPLNLNAKLGLGINTKLASPNNSKGFTKE